MSKAVLLLGTNLGDKSVNLLEVQTLLGENVCRITQKSSVYRTPPWGFESSHDFLNQVLVVETELDPLVLLEKLQEIEQIMGRLRIAKNNTQGYQDRLMDIDILFYGEQVINVEGLIIPHPHISKRRFTLEPLNEIMPEFVHPVLLQNIKTLLLHCPDTGDVFKI